MIVMLRTLDRRIISTDLLKQINLHVAKLKGWEKGSFSIFFSMFEDSSTALMIDLPCGIESHEYEVTLEISDIVDQILPFE